MRGQQANGNIERIEYSREFVGLSVVVGILQNRNAVVPLTYFRGGRIFCRLRYPQPSFGIERHVEGLANEGFRREQLNFEAGLKRKTGHFFGW